LLGKASGCGSGWGEAEQLAAIFCPRDTQGRAWRSFSQRRPARSPAANAALEMHIWRTDAACPTSRAVPFAAISSNARSTAVCSTDAV
jgi:hypothetical protein